MRTDELNRRLEEQANQDRAERSRINHRLERALQTLNDPQSTPSQRTEALNQWREDTGELDTLDRRNAL